MKKKIISFIMILFIIINLNIRADIDYEKNYSYYEKICNTRSSYSLNQEACDGFEKYKKEKASGVAQAKEKLNDSGLTADKLAQYINSNNELIEKTENKLYENEQKMNNNKAKIDELERNVINRIETMQYYGDENQVIDIIMSSTNLDDLMTRIDGISFLNASNVEAIYELEKTTKELEDARIYLNSELNTLKETKKKQENLLREFYQKESSMYSGKDSGGHASVNTELNNVDFSKIDDKNEGWLRPTEHAIASASTWAYVGGGWHPGLDLATSNGSKLLAPADGVLLAKSNSGGYGNHIVIATRKDNYVYTFLFAHLSSISNINTFKRGDVISYTGNTGWTTGPHVHVEVFKHNTNDLNAVISQFKSKNDYWFGLGYSTIGDCNKVCRIQPKDLFKVNVGDRY